MARRLLPLGAALVLGLALRAIGLARWLPDVFEEATPVVRALGFWGWKSGAFDFHPHFFNYPALSFWLHFVVQAVAGLFLWIGGAASSMDAFRQLLQEQFGNLVLLGRAVTVACDLGTVWATWRLGCRLRDEWTGGLAALLVATSALHVTLSQSVTVDPPLTLLVTLGMLFVLDALERGSLRDFAIAGAVIGLATATKYTAALMLVPVGVVGVWRRADRGRLPWWGGPVVAGAAALGLFAVLNPYVLLDTGAFLRDFAFEREHMAAGHFGLEAEGSSLWSYALALGRTGSVVFVAAVGGLVLAVRRRDRARGILWVWIGVYLGVLLTWEMRVDRYLLPLVPALLALGADALVEGARGLRNRSLLAAAATVVALLYLAPQATALSSRHARVGQRHTLTELRQWARQHVDDDELVAFEAHSLDAADRPGLALLIPLVVVRPEAVSAFYDPRWYEGFDLFVVSSDVYGRFQADAAAYPEAVALYDHLRTRWQVARRFEGEAGPTVIVYRNLKPPGQDTVYPPELYLTLNGAPAPVVSSFLTQLSDVLRQRGRLERAWDVTDRLALFESRDPRLPRRAGRLFSELGEAMALRGDDERARTAFGLAASLDPRYRVRRPPRRD